MRGSENAKAMAKTLRQELKGRNIEIGHSDCLQIVARQFGYRNWNTMSGIAGDPDEADLKPLPQGWETMSTNRALYRVGVEQGAGLEGRSAIRIQGQGTEYVGNLLGWALIKQVFSAENYRGHNVRFSASLRCEDLADVTYPYLVVEDALGKKIVLLGKLELTAENMLSGTTGWRRIDLIAAVPDHAHRIEIGVHLHSTVGTTWAADMDFRETTEPVTQIYWVQQKAPQNLSLVAA